MKIPYRGYICGVKISRICQNLGVNHINLLFLCIIFPKHEVGENFSPQNIPPIIMTIKMSDMEEKPCHGCASLKEKF